MSIITRLIIIARSFKTIQRIKRRDYNITGEFDTYCIISVWIVRTVQLATFAYCLNSLSFVWLLWTDNEEYCFAINYVNLVFFSLNEGTRVLIILLLWAEQYAQRILIQFESKYSASEVYYVYCNTRKFI